MQYASGTALPIGSDAVVFGRELLRRQRRDLHAIFHCNTQQLNLLAATGAATRAECGFSGLEVFGFAHGLRRAVESGRLALEDYSNLAMPLRFPGGALGWPFVPATVNIGSDIQDRSRRVRPWTSAIAVSLGQRRTRRQQRTTVQDNPSRSNGSRPHFACSPQSRRPYLPHACGRLTLRR
jgi:hypothetical protein